MAGELSVLDPGEVAEHVPGEVCVLTQRQRVGGEGAPPQLCTLRQGQVAVLGYTSAATLITLCGTGQPWQWMPSAEMPALGRRHGFDVVLLDVAPPEELARAEVDPIDAPDAEEVPELAADGLVYLPSKPVRAGDQRVLLELQPDRRGRRTLLAYTSTGELVAGCGQYQPWVAVLAERLPAVAAEAGAEMVLFNPTLSEDAQHTGPVQDWTRQ